MRQLFYKRENPALFRQHLYGVALKNFRPVAFASNLHNEKIAVENRVMKLTPQTNAAYMRRFTSFVKNNVRKIFPKTCKLPYIDELPFDLYIQKSNATPLVKKQLILTHTKLSLDNITSSTPLREDQIKDWVTRKSFVKVENLCYRSPYGCFNKPPRLIQGACPEFISLVGPWIAALQEKLKRDWNANNFIVFTSGVSSMKAANKLMELSGSIFENDVSAWDASYGLALCKLELWLAEYFGAPVAVSQLMERNIKTSGVTAHGLKYRCGAMRKSGDPYTSLFNSIMNGLIHLFIYCDHYGLSVDESRAYLRMLVQGDDMVLSSTLPGRPDYKTCMSNLGFKSDSIFRDKFYHTEFCSMTLLSCNEGFNFVPKAGRLWDKSGYFVDPPKDVDPYVLVRGAALGLYQGCKSHPLIKPLLDMYLELTKHVEAHPMKRFEWQMILSDWTPNHSTLFQIFDRYGVTEIPKLELKLGDEFENTTVEYIVQRDIDAPWLFKPVSDYCSEYMSA
jgi:hypothetical protein